MSVSEQWIQAGCAKAAELRAAGQFDAAAEVLGYIERRAVGRVRPEAAITAEQRAWLRKDRDKRRNAAIRALGCEVKGCTNKRAKTHWRWCLRHRPDVARVFFEGRAA